MRRQVEILLQLPTTPEDDMTTDYDNYNPNNRQHPKASEMIAKGIGVYLQLKMAVLGYQAGKRARDNGATMEQSIKVGVITGLTWAAFMVFTAFNSWQSAAFFSRLSLSEYTVMPRWVSSSPSTC